MEVPPIKSNASNYPYKQTGDQCVLYPEVLQNTPEHRSNLYLLLQHQVCMTSICQTAKKLQREHLFCSGSSTTNNWHKEHNIVSVRAEQ